MYSIKLMKELLLRKFLLRRCKEDAGEVRFRELSQPVVMKNKQQDNSEVDTSNL